MNSIRIEGKLTGVCSINVTVGNDAQRVTAGQLCTRSSSRVQRNAQNGHRLGTEQVPMGQLRWAKWDDSRLTCM